MENLNRERKIKYILGQHHVIKKCPRKSKYKYKMAKLVKNIGRVDTKFLKEYDTHYYVMLISSDTISIPSSTFMSTMTMCFSLSRTTYRKTTFSYKII